MRKYIILWVLLFCFSCCFCVEASTGSLDIVTNDSEDFSFVYTKIGDYHNGEFLLDDKFKASGVDLSDLTNGEKMRDAIGKLERYKGKEVKMGKENRMAEGIYLIKGVPKEGYDISSTLVSIPSWDETEKEMTYQVTIYPKIQKNVESVETGDSSLVLPLIGLCTISLLVVVSVSGSAYFLKDK